MIRKKFVLVTDGPERGYLYRVDIPVGITIYDVIIRFRFPIKCNRFALEPIDFSTDPMGCKFQISDEEIIRSRIMQLPANVIFCNSKLPCERPHFDILTHGTNVNFPEYLEYHTKFSKYSIVVQKFWDDPFRVERAGVKDKNVFTDRNATDYASGTPKIWKLHLNLYHYTFVSFFFIKTDFTIFNVRAYLNEKFVARQTHFQIEPGLHCVSFIGISTRNDLKKYVCFNWCRRPLQVNQHDSVMIKCNGIPHNPAEFTYCEVSKAWKQRIHVFICSN